MQHLMEAKPFSTLCALRKLKETNKEPVNHHKRFVLFQFGHSNFGKFWSYKSHTSTRWDKVLFCNHKKLATSLCKFESNSAILAKKIPLIGPQTGF